MNIELNSAAREAAGGTIQEEAWLLGQPSLSTYLDFLEEMRAEKGRFDRSAAVDEWRAANDYYYDMEQSEAGAVDQLDAADIDPSLSELATTVMAEARFRRAFEFGARLALRCSSSTG